MRITSKVIQNNALSNINTNKILQDKLNNQMSTEKKINRPSDDPVIAIRALRLRTNVSQITQYYEKNAPDAESWMKVTEDALSTVSSVITDMIEQCGKGANEKLTSEDRQTILDALNQLRDEVYATGNADYAGRSVFTGYRTETTLKFTADEKKKYSITEQVDKTALDEITYIDSGSINSINDSNFNDPVHKNILENQVTSNSIYRLRLSYDSLDAADAYETGVTPTLMTYDSATGTFTPVTKDDGAGNLVPIEPKVVAVNEDPDPYMSVGEDDIIVIKETGEMLLGKNVYNQLMAKEDDPTTEINEAEFRVTYQKTNWEKDDLKPEHYFACTDSTDPAKPIVYNQDYLDLTGAVEKQAIEYDVGLNQAIRVNTTADEVFLHSIGRDVDDMINAMQDVVDMENTVATLTKMVESDKYDDITKETIQNQLDAANKALTFLKEKAQKMFEGGITKMQNHLNTVNGAVTRCGTRGKKLELIQNRLMSQKTNFETLQADNENADLTDVAIELSSAELTYEAALMATGKIMQTSLMNYI